jgi:hypothetical protein
MPGIGSTELYVFATTVPRPDAARNSGIAPLLATSRVRGARKQRSGAPVAAQIAWLDALSPSETLEPPIPDFRNPGALSRPE